MRLVESGRKRNMTVGGGILSLLLHIGLISLAVFGAARVAVEATPREKQERIVFIAPPKPPEVAPAPKRTAPKPAVPAKKDPVPAVPELPKEPPLVIPPVNIPDKLPEIDSSKAVTNEEDFVRRGKTPAPVSTGESTGTGPAPIKTGLYQASEVDVSPSVIGGYSTPEYPESLRRAGIEGQAVVEFVVDARGRVDMATFTVIEATHPSFVSAVRDALPRMRFRPGQVRGKKVNTRVRIPFSFVIKG